MQALLSYFVTVGLIHFLVFSLPVSFLLSLQSSLKVRSVRRTSSAKVSSLIDEASPTNTGNKAKFLRRFDLHNEREAPESLPTRSLSQPSGLESCGMNRNDLEADSDSDSVTSHDDGR